VAVRPWRRARRPPPDFGLDRHVGPLALPAGIRLTSRPKALCLVRSRRSFPAELLRTFPPWVLCDPVAIRRVSIEPRQAATHTGDDCEQRRIRPYRPVPTCGSNEAPAPPPEPVRVVRSATPPHSGQTAADWLESVLMKAPLFGCGHPIACPAAAVLNSVVQGRTPRVEYRGGSSRAERW